MVVVEPLNDDGYIVVDGTEERAVVCVDTRVEVFGEFAGVPGESEKYKPKANARTTTTPVTATLLLAFMLVDPSDDCGRI